MLLFIVLESFARSTCMMWNDRALRIFSISNHIWGAYEGEQENT